MKTMTTPMFGRVLGATLVVMLSMGSASAANGTKAAVQPVGDGYGDVPSVFESEIVRFRGLAASGIEELQIEAAQGFYYLKHKRGEAIILPLLNSDDPIVRLEAVKALGVCGGRKAVEGLIATISDKNWEVRANAIDALRRMTAHDAPADARAWREWLNASDWSVKEAELITGLSSNNKARALSALQALVHIGTPTAEDAILKHGIRVGPQGPRLVTKALERVGTERSLPLLLRLAGKAPDFTWPLVEIGGDRPEVEETLLAAFARMPTNPTVMVNLDRIHSTGAAPQSGQLLRAFGLVIYRAATDDLHRPPTSTQRLAANLLLRTGQSQKIVKLILDEIEGVRRDEDTPEFLRQTLTSMREELKPGFQRLDTGNVALPLASLGHITRDPVFTPRMLKLLDHPNYVVRIYAAEALAALHAEEAVAPILRVINQPYGFADATTLTSGKHRDKSQTVRWRGYLAIALGKLGGEEARVALEKLATNPETFRDIRY
ncbi:MAG: HEAT repeat domain-containing protein, partial [Planctomycetota bacterium]